MQKKQRFRDGKGLYGSKKKYYDETVRPDSGQQMILREGKRWKCRFAE